MHKLLVSNFTLSPDHFPFDGIKTHNFELIQTLKNTECSLSLLLSVDRLSKSKSLSPMNQFLLNNRAWQLKRKQKFVKFKLIKNLMHYNREHFNGAELLSSSFAQWGLFDKIYMEELLKRKANTYYDIRKKLWSIPGYSEYDLFLQSYPFPAYVKNIPNVIFIHDAIPLTHPHLVNASSPRRWFNLMKTILKQYDRILVISEHTKHTLLEHFDIDEKRIDVVYQSVNSNTERYKDADVSSILTPMNLEPKKFLLYVARFEPRKNHERLLEAYQYADVNLPLVLIGRLDSKKWILPPSIKKLIQHPETFEIEKSAAALEKNVIELSANKKIIWFQDVSDVTLSVLYQAAKGLIFPSEAEGFGLPIVEAFTYGCPVAAANVTAIPEVTKDAAHLFDPYSIQDMAKAMRELCYDDDKCAHLADLGRERAAYFSREQYKERLMNSLSSLL